MIVNSIVLFFLLFFFLNINVCLYECSHFSWFNFSGVPQISRVKKPQEINIDCNFISCPQSPLLHFRAEGISLFAKIYTRGKYCYYLIVYNFRVMDFIVWRFFKTYFHLSLALSCLFLHIL